MKIKDSLHKVFQTIQMTPGLRSFLTVLLILITATVLSGCHFVGDLEASAGPSGFWAGLWDGTVFWWSLILQIFSDIKMYDPVNTGFGYKVGYAFGVLCLSWNFGTFCGIISLICYWSFL